jgi:hypothetical protein
MKTQSAVQWLVEQLTYENGFAARLTSFNGDSNVSEIVEQAKQMEKEQIIEAYDDGWLYNNQGKYNPEQYYKEKYNAQ